MRAPVVWGEGGAMAAVVHWGGGGAQADNGGALGWRWDTGRRWSEGALGRRWGVSG